MTGKKNFLYIKIKSIVVIFFITLFIPNNNLYSQVVANAGSDKEYCSGDTAALGGTPVAQGGSGDYSYNWTPPDDLDDPTDSLPTTFTDITREYTLVVIDNITGLTDTSSTTITVFQLPLVDAGEDQLVCITASIISISLSGSISGSTNTGLWSTTGDGSFPAGDNIMFASYNPGNIDKISDTVSIILTSTNNGECLPVSDTMNLLFYPRIIANAGNDITTCNDFQPVDLHGSVSGGTTSGTWVTRGSGTFTPSSDSLQTSYIPDITDTISEGIYLILSSTKNRGCPASSDSIFFKLIKYPVLSAGNDISVNTRSVPLNVTVENVNNIKWSSNGTGSFYPSDTLPNTSYIFSANEILSDSEITMIISTTNNTYCPTVSDTIIITNISSKIPNAFTPDEDGINDVFMKGENIKIFNRWGQLLYSGSDGWDGKYKNEKVSSGTYFYIVTFHDEYGNISNIRGTLTLIMK